MHSCNVSRTGDAKKSSARLYFVFMPASVVLKHLSRVCCHIHVAVGGDTESL